MHATVATDVPRRPSDRPTTGDRVFRLIVIGAASAALLVIVLTIIFLFDESRPALSATGLGDFLTKSVWDVSSNEFGVFGLLGGTVIIAAVAMVIAVPLAVMMAIFINEYAPPRLARVLTTVVDLLAALPSILFALWARDVLPSRLQPVARWLSEHLVALPFFQVTGDDVLLARSSFNAGLVVSVMVLPIITAVTREVMTQVPREQCEGALALGGTRWAMIREVILPFARPGIIGASLLGFGRALGETIAVAYIIQLSYKVNTHILESGAGSVSANIAIRFGEATPVERSGLVATGLALLLLTFGVSLVARRIVARSARF